MGKKKYQKKPWETYFNNLRVQKTFSSMIQNPESIKKDREEKISTP